MLAHHIADAQEHMTEQLRDRRATALEGPLRLRVDLAEADRDVFVVCVELVLQLGIADRGRDRIQVWVAVPGDIDRPPSQGFVLTRGHIDMIRDRALRCQLGQLRRAGVPP